jgi:hypothetical protein
VVFGKGSKEHFRRDHMNGLRLAALVASVVVLIPVFLDFVLLQYLSLNASGRLCADICDASVTLSMWGLVDFVLPATAVAAVCAAIDAGRHRDTLSVALLSLQFPLSIAAIIYLFIATTTTNGPDGPGTQTSSTALAVMVGLGCVLIPPVATLLYALLRDLSNLHRVILSALAAVVIVATLAVEPPWIDFTRANRSPVLTTSAPNTTVHCPDGPFPPITVQNAGSRVLQWSAESLGKPDIVPVTISPARGLLSSGELQQVTISGPATAAGGGYQAVSITFTSNGGTQDVVFTCR